MNHLRWVRSISKGRYPLRRARLSEQPRRRTQGIHAVRGIVRTRVDATRLLMVVHRSQSRFFSRARDHPPGCAGSSSSTGNGCILILPYGQFVAHRPQPMHQSSMMTSSEFAAADGADRAADHAQRIAALAAGGGDQVLVEAQAFADQAA